MMNQLSAVWLLLATAAAIELYDEVPPAELDNEMTYQDNNNIDAVHGRGVQVDAAEAARLQDLLLLYRLLESQLGDEIRKTERRNHKKLQVAAVSDSLVKRFAQSTQALPQQRWKSKKGRSVGSVCYFKLCAFRNPV